MIGVLGGMGPMATIDFLQRLIDLTNGRSDQEHVPTLVCSLPQIPDRSSYIVAKGEDPYPLLLDAINRLISGGAESIVIPCCTAHHWYDMLVDNSSIPIFHVAIEIAEYLKAKNIQKVGLIATEGTYKSNYFKRILKQYGIEVTYPNNLDIQMIMAGIRQIKHGSLNLGAKNLLRVMNHKNYSEIQKWILGCTELPLALRSFNQELLSGCVDSNEILARACFEYWENKASK
ncbi:aspartate/glutamate racemase family protein [Microbulbifer epialgicus]|uniref:Aspartate/glutamate racemase family protein n=1 Tax=Microbulbifer epialgicus TaxID=393907 RepID=A0ABV4P396_9GAMM